MNVIQWQKVTSISIFLPQGRRQSDNETYTAKVILMYHFPYWHKLVPGTHHFSACNSSCILTVDMELTSKADCVVFYSHYATFNGSLPPPRHRNSVWALFASESPVHSAMQAFANPSWWNEFNWTISYRRDSDFYSGYGDFIRRPAPVPIYEATPALDKKTKMVAWFVSNCRTQSKREVLVDVLKRHISVDVYGQCGSLKCDLKDRSHCIDMLSRDYYFYLSFENSLCVDYVTEKVFSIMKYANTIPVVFGGANYTSLLPRNSFIDVSSFASMAELSNYLKKVAFDRKLYKSYFEWRREWIVLFPPNLPLCDLCYRVHHPNSFKKVYRDIFTWWDRDKCHNPNLVIQ